MRAMALVAVTVLCLGVAAAIAGTVKKEDIIDWPELGEMDYETGQCPDNLQAKMNGGKVSVAGYVIPAGATDWDEISEFLLIPFKMDCCQGPPPNGNQIIMVTMETGVPFDDLLGYVSVLGHLSVFEKSEDFGFALTGGELQEIEYDF